MSLPESGNKLDAVDARVAECVQAETEFVEACIAVWEEIDRLSAEPGGYKGLAPETALRKRERAAWERYRDLIWGPKAMTPTSFRGRA